METSLKTGFAQIFSCCPKNLSCPNFGGAAAPLASPARTPMFRKFEQIMAKLIFDLIDLNYGMNSMKDSSVVLPINLKKNYNFAFH